MDIAQAEDLEMEGSPPALPFSSYRPYFSTLTKALAPSPFSYLISFLHPLHYHSASTFPNPLQPSHTPISPPSHPSHTPHRCLRRILRLLNLPHHRRLPREIRRHARTLRRRKRHAGPRLRAHRNLQTRLPGENEQGDRRSQGAITEYDAESSGGGFQGGEESLIA